MERARLRHADGARLRRAGCALRPRRRGGRDPRGGRLGRVPAPTGGPVSRRDADRGRRRRLHLSDAGREGASAVPHPVPRRGRREGGRPSQGPVRFQARAASRPSGSARGAAGAVEGVLRQGRVRQNDLHPAAVQRTLPRRRGGARTVGDLRAGDRLLGARPAGQSRPLQFRPDQNRLLPRPRHRLRGDLRRPVRLPRGVHVQELGDPVRQAAGAQGVDGARDAARRDAVGRAGVFLQPQAGQVQGPPGAPRPRPRVRLRMDQQEPVLRALRAHQLDVRELPARRPRPAQQGRALAARAVPGQDPRGGLHPSPTRPMSPTAPARSAANCARPPGCCARRATG